MSSIFGLQFKGGKTSTLDAMSRDTFRDQLSACFKAGTDRISNFNRTCSNQALMTSIALANIRPVNPSYEMFVLMSEGYYAYRDIHCYSDSATISIRRFLDPNTQYYAFDERGVPLDDQSYLCHAHYVVMAWQDKGSGAIIAAGRSYLMASQVMVPTHEVISELKRPFSGLASIQLFEDAEAFGRGFRNSNPSQGFMRLARTALAYHYDELSVLGDKKAINVALVGSEDRRESIVRWLEDLSLYYPRFNGVGSDLDIPDALAGTDRIRMRNQAMRDRQPESISSYIHYLDFIFGTESSMMIGTDIENQEMARTKEWVGVLKSGVFDPINLITQSDRCFLESASGFKYINVPGLDSSAIFAAITSAFLLSLMANNRSEVFMSYVPYGPRDILTNGEFDLGGYTNGSMWFSDEGAQTHSHFTENLRGKSWFGQLKINSRKADDRDLVIDVVAGTKVIGNEVVLHLNEVDDDFYNVDDGFHCEKEGTTSSQLDIDEWTICHGHRVIQTNLGFDDLYGSKGPNAPASLEEPTGSHWHRLSLEQNEKGQFTVPAYLMAGRI